MKIIKTILSCIVFTVSLAGCSSLNTQTGNNEQNAETSSPVTETAGSQTSGDYPAAIMVDGEIYLKSYGALPAEIDESAVIGYTVSYTDAFPGKDGETNFNRELNMPYARTEGGIAVLYQKEWYLCTPKDK